ncbi:MAG: thiol-disulfide oxidoreductase DCC family protein [Aquirufa sp.]
MKNIRIAIDGNCNFCRFSSNLLKRMLSIPVEIYFQGSQECLQWEKKVPSEQWKSDTLKVVAENQLYIKSSAIKYLMQFSKWYFQPFRIIFLLPKSFLDVGYDFIAKNRYLWGKTCSIS